MPDSATKALEHKLDCVRCVLAATLLCFFALAPRLWLDQPFWGVVPSLEGLPAIEAPLDYVFLVAMVVLLFPLLLPGLRNKRSWLLAWCVVFAARAIGDRMTWQPYFLESFFMLLVLAWADSPASKPAQRGKRHKRDLEAALSARRAEALNLLRLIVAGVYFWAGLSKFNHHFVTAGMPQLLEPSLPASALDFVSDWLLVIPIVETSIALLLVTRRFRNAGAVAAIGMHLSILWLLGPWGANLNAIVWPWSVSRIVLVYLLYWNKEEVTARDVLWGRPSWIRGVVLVVFVVLPALSLVGRWPDHLAFQLYSGRSCDAAVYMKRGFIEKLPPDVRDEVIPSKSRGCDGHLMLLPWAERELGAIAPTDPLVYRHVARKLGRLAEEPSDVLLVIRRWPSRWHSKTTMQEVTWEELTE